MRRRICFSVFVLLASLVTGVSNPAHSTSANSDYEPDPTSPDEVFAQMQHSFRPDKARGQHLRYQFNLSDPQGGKWWILINDGAYTMGKGTIDKPDVTFNCTGADWVQLSNGTLHGFQAFFTGRLKITGNQFTAHRLDEMFP
jgi:putative sterol carrier protein